MVKKQINATPTLKSAKNVLSTPFKQTPIKLKLKAHIMVTKMSLFIFFPNLKFSHNYKKLN